MTESTEEREGFLMRGPGGQTGGYAALHIAEATKEDRMVQALLSLYARRSGGSANREQDSGLDPYRVQGQSSVDRPQLRRDRHG